MLPWAKLQPPDENPSLEKMNCAIDEDWFGGHCALCSKYHEKISGFSSCRKCPIHRKFGKDCYSIGWFKIQRAKTWKMWIQLAEIFYEKLKQL